MNRSPSLGFAVGLAVLVLPGSPARAIEVGLDAGAPVWDGVINAGAHDAVASTGVPWVRVNFRVDAWSSVDDTTPRGPDKVGWMQAFDRIVDGYLARGLQVYGVLNDELVSGPKDLDSDGFRATFVQSAVKVVDHFKNRVRVFEVINEPNDWAGGNTARMSAASFAKVLQDTYVAVKQAHAADPCWQVKLVSGPLFSFDGASDAGYLAATYAAGKQSGWENVRAAMGTYPLDGIGYHIYVAQGAADSLDSVKAAVQDNLAAIWSTITASEPAGGATSKRIWVSEYGFRANVVGASGQADRLEAAFQQMKTQGKVELAVYFQLQDFPDNLFGVFSEGGLDAAHRRPAADRLLAIAQANRPQHAAHVLSLIAPKLVAGQAGEVQITLENRGSATWGDGWRLGAAPGCPEATIRNAITWKPGAGYAKSPTDARLYLASPVAPGSKVTLKVNVLATTPGKVLFGARMLQEMVTWFGSTAAVELEVAAGPVAGDGGPRPPRTELGPPSEAGPGSGSEAGTADPPGGGGVTPASGCGCRAGGDGPCAGLLLLLLLAVAGVGRRRLQRGSGQPR